MVLLRAIVFNLLSWLIFAGLGVLYLPLLLIPGRAGERVMMTAGTAWSRLMLRLAETVVGLDYEVRGQTNIPPGAALFAIKHQSAWDTLAVATLLPQPVVVLKRELFWVPFYGWYAKRAGMIAIDRGGGASALRRMLRAAQAAVAKGRPLAIFPQGTRTLPVSLGGAPKPYQPGVAALYGELGIPVVPVALNSGLFWRRRAFRKNPGRIIVEFLPPIAPGLAKREFLARLETTIETATDRLEAEGIEGTRPQTRPVNSMR
jgi:1-acyl-sn-glycerol-3-phosphate acyltransferase